MQHDFYLVDVFSATEFSGNPLAVVIPSEHMAAEQMQRIARWLGYSETTFLLPAQDPAADYRVRIFSPNSEFDFAGHPTLGTAHVWLTRQGQEALSCGRDVVQECGIGRVVVRRSDNVLSFAAPELRRSGPLSRTELQECVDALGIHTSDILRHAWGDNGSGWCVLQLRSHALLEQLGPNRGQAGLKIGVCALSPDPDIAYEIRALGPGYEDPVTGSLNAACAQWLRAKGVVPEHYVVSQGRCVNSDGRVSVTDDGQDVWIGGEVRLQVAGKIST